MPAGPLVLSSEGADVAAAERFSCLDLQQPRKSWAGEQGVALPSGMTAQGRRYPQTWY